MTKPLKPDSLRPAARTDADAHPVDRHVGLRMRMRRKELGFSQERLADAVGLTFQQVQKYERGSNRVSASRLWEIAGALKVTISYFYEGLPTPEADQGAASGDVQNLLMSSDGSELAASFVRIGDQKVRRKVVELIRALAEEDAVG